MVLRERAWKDRDILDTKNRDTAKVANIRGWMSVLAYSYIPILLYIAYLCFGIKIFIVMVCTVFALHIFQKLTDRYNIRPIREEERVLLSEKKLIHYTDNLGSVDEKYYSTTGKVRLLGNNNPVSNYRLKYRDKLRSFVWFHLEDQPEEPYLRGFIESHGVESCPRKYKVITKFCDLQGRNIYINPVNKNILIEGDLEVDGQLFTHFNWFDNKIYLFSIIKYSLVWGTVVWFDIFQKIIGSFLEIRDRKKN